VPRQVSFVGELPKTPSGKIDRRSLRETEAVA
jgi:acyl-coenzyme A synthetase/AMP-(fatty) acid ligase